METRVKTIARTGTIPFLLILVLFGRMAAENLEKGQKKALEAHAKAIIAEAKTLETAGRLAEARIKYAESQAMLETKEALEAVKHLDDEIHKRVNNALNQSRKLYEAHKYKDALAELEQAMKMGASEGVLSFDVALCHFQLGERDKAVENLDNAIRDTQDPKAKQKLQQLLTSLVTGENSSVAGEKDREQVVKFNHLADSLGFDASLQNDSLESDVTTDDEAFSAAEPPGAHVSKASLQQDLVPRSNSHSVSNHNSNVCATLEELKSEVRSPSTVFDRANCAGINGHPEEAIRLLQQYKESAPQALESERVQARIAALQSLLALPDPRGPEIRKLYAAAYAYLAERKYDRAIAGFEKAKSVSPEFVLTYWKLALLSEAMGYLDRARENFVRYQQLAQDQSAKDEAEFHLATLDAKRSKYDEEVGDAEDILSELFNRAMNLTFNLDGSRSAIRVHRAQVKKKQDQKKDQNRVGGFAIPYAYAQQELSRASEHLQAALALFPLAPEANELMGLVYLQANDGRAAVKSYDEVVSFGFAGGVLCGNARPQTGSRREVRTDARQSATDLLILVRQEGQSDSA